MFFEIACAKNQFESRQSLYYRIERVRLDAAIFHASAHNPHVARLIYERENTKTKIKTDQIK